MIAERLAAKPFASKRLSEIHSAIVEDGELMASLVRSMIEASWRGESYLARAHSVEARQVFIRIMKLTGEAQELESALKLEAAKNADAA